MEIIYILAPLTIVLAIVFLLFFVRSTKAGQFEDTQGPAFRMLSDDLKKSPDINQDMNNEKEGSHE